MATQEEITDKIANNFDRLKNNEQHARTLEKKLKDQTKKDLGEKIFEEYYLPKECDTDSLLRDNSIFRGRFEENHSFPFSDKQFQEFLSLKKFPVSRPICTKNAKDHKVQGMYLAAIDKHDRLVLYALTIVNDGAYDDFEKTTIRLEMCVGGQEWMSLLRLDNAGAPHPNYIENGKLVNNLSEVKVIESPHLHRNCHESEVLAHDFKDYTPAEAVTEPVRDLKESLDYFLKEANISVKMNPRLASSDNYKYDHRESLFDMEDVQRGIDKFENKFLEILENSNAKECS